MKRLIVGLCMLCMHLVGFAQHNESLSLQKRIWKIGPLLEKIELQTSYTFAYNTNLFTPGTQIEIPDNLDKLEPVLNYISNELLLDYKLVEDDRKIILSRTKNLWISGQVLDSLSLESIIGATVYSKKKMTLTNVDGYFNMEVDIDDDTLYIQNLGYGHSIVVLTQKQTAKQIYLRPSIELDIVIVPEYRPEIHRDGKLDIASFINNAGITGSSDVVSYLKSKAGVSVGSEGQNGFNVRGGGTHQNLILMDGIPIYESSHLAGLSSIFLDGAVKSAEFYKSNFPARYGGRLSSVLDVRLKDGNKNEYSRSLAFGLEGITAHIDGPLGKNTTININGRGSWFSSVIRPIVKSTRDVNNLSLNYSDIYAKLTHWFTPTNKISINAYTGEDLIKIERNNIGLDTIGFRDFNRIGWSNQVADFSWQNLLSDKLFLNAHIGATRYNYHSRGSYALFYNTPDTFSNTNFDITATSEISDIIAGLQLNYYSTNWGDLSFGFSFTDHNNRPNITEQKSFGDVNENPVNNSDTLYQTQEYVSFIDYSYTINNRWSFNGGLRFSSYKNKETTYNILEPRLSIGLFGRLGRVSVSYARMSQFIHLLSNPGAGLPSDLWVPSTQYLAPEISHNFSIDYLYKREHFSLGISSFYRTIKNLIEYSNPSDVIYSIIIDNELYQIEVNNNDWEERIDVGEGRTYGIELQGSLKSKDHKVRFNYSLSRSERTFLAFDDGDYFPYRYDRPHNIAVNYSYALASNKSINVNWVFGSGNAYSLSDVRRLNAQGMSILEPSSRNNFRVENFHHLDISYTVTKELKNSQLLINLGVYNVYNRYNPFYEFLSQSEESAAPDLLKISIFPTLPQLNLTYKW